MQKGIARCLAGTNIIKDAENKVGAKPTIKQFFGDVQPSTVLSSYRYAHNPDWCPFEKGQNCANGAILPTITQRNQGQYLPPMVRDDIPIADQGTTKMT